MKRRVLSLITTLALCLNLCPTWALAIDERTEDGLCPHHQAHTEECGYVPEDSGAPCTFDCKICSINDLIRELSNSASMDNSEQMEAQLSEIYDLYDELTEDEQMQVDLSPCLFQQNQVYGANVGTQADSGSPDLEYVLDKDREIATTHEVSVTRVFDTKGYTYTCTNATAIRVTGTGKLYLKGTIRSQNGAGVEVQSEGFLSIEDPNAVIAGWTYGLDVASDAEIYLSGGTFSGKTAAIRIQTKNGESADFSALLEPGYAYFDVDGSPIPPADVAQKTKVLVGKCTNHLGKSYTPNAGTPTHTWTCPACGAGETEACTFTFDQDGNGTCACRNTITIAVTESGLTDLVYDGTLKPGTRPPVTVTLTDGSNKGLSEGTDYAVNYVPRKDAGEITVTVTGLTFDGEFTKTYNVERDRPALEWDTTTKPLPITVNYDGSRVEASDLPPVKINIKSENDNLQEHLQYSYKKSSDSTYTDGLPTNAGTYDVMVSLPEMPNFHAVSSEPITLTVNKIPAVTTAPKAQTLTYNREAQQLVTAGVLKPDAIAERAKIEFKLGTDGAYSPDIPTGIGVSSYNVYYRVADTENYSGVSETLVPNPNATSTYKSARINHKEVKPTIELEYYTTLYTGGDKEPVVTAVKDGEAVIPKSEYTVAYSNNRNVGTATVTVSNADNGNYKIQTATATFKITSKEQAALSITKQPDTVTYGDKFTLGTSGGSGNGNVTWAITSGAAVAKVDANSGQVTIIGDGQATVKATKSGTDPNSTPAVTNYEPATASWTFTADQKPVVATVTADDKTFDGNKNATVHAVVEQGVLSGDEVTISGLTGTFDNENVGTDKTVTVTIPNSAKITGRNSGHYAVTYSSTTVKAAIRMADAEIETPPQPNNRVYDTTEQPLLVSGGTTVNGVGKIVYSLSQNDEYSENIPRATNAATYTVWYKVADSVNYTGIVAASVKVEIAKATPKIVTDPTASSITSDQPLSASTLTGNNEGGVPGTFAWAEEVDAPVNGDKYDVIFTPGDIANYNPVTIQIPVTVSDDNSDPGDNEAAEPNRMPVTSTPSASKAPMTTTVRNGTTSASPKATVQNGTASAVLDTADGSKLVEAAVANQSQNVVVRPEITSDVTKAEVSIPASTVKQIESKTDAALTVSTPIADVTLPNAALSTLSSEGGTVDVVTEQVEQGVALTLTAGGKNVENVPGGLTLTVPVEDAGPGTVAVLVSDDGTRETVRKSIVEDDKMSIPLSGSATVEIVDNSKDFTDVPSTSWASDAVAFASAHELFNGTSETTFSPNEPMSRGMLATMLYNLEGRPDQDLTSEFSDVSSEAWYADGVSWATANGITNGYENGQFGPNDSITREQFAVMLWKYAGSPEASGEGLGLEFTDADQASSYALQALNWAVENGILNGYGNGQLDPGGIVTRAQAAQMLKNLMENT